MPYLNPDLCQFIRKLSLFIFITCFAIVNNQLVFGEELRSNAEKERELKKQKEFKESRQRIPNHTYGYIDRTHTLNESLRHISAMYLVTWAIYPLTQPSVVKDKGSWKNWRHNFGSLVFDKDEPFWNWFVHPISGSQLYLYYRANGYNRINSLGMAFISSTLFEFTVEIYTEPASVQDLYQTPILGSVLGVGLETLSMYLLNTGNTFGKIAGHILNPSTLFWFYEGKVKVLPQTDFKNKAGLFLVGEF